MSKLAWVTGNGAPPLRGTRLIHQPSATSTWVASTAIGAAPAMPPTTPTIDPVCVRR